MICQRFFEAIDAVVERITEGCVFGLIPSAPRPRIKRPPLISSRCRPSWPGRLDYETRR